MTTLKSIALELLQKYEESKTSVIWEYSGTIEKDEKYLAAEVAKYRELIDKYAEQEQEDVEDDTPYDTWTILCDSCGSEIAFCPYCGTELKGGE